MPSKSWASSALPAGRGAQQPRFQCTVAVLGDAIPEHPQTHSKEVGNPSSPPRPASARISSPSPGQKQERPRSPRAGTCVPGRIPTGPSCGGTYGSQNPTPWTAHSDACSLTTTPLPGPAQAPSWVCRWALGEQLLVEALCREPRQPATSPKAPPCKFQFRSLQLSRGSFQLLAHVWENMYPMERAFPLGSERATARGEVVQPQLWAQGKQLRSGLVEPRESVPPRGADPTGRLRGPGAFTFH